MSKVEVRPIDVKRYHGNSGKNSITQVKVIEALYSPSKGMLETGLSLEELEILGKRMGVDLNPVIDPTVAHPFFSSKRAKVRLENKTMIFDTDTDIGKIHVALMKVDKLVANSKKGLDAGEYPFATHYIHDEEENHEEKATRAEMRTKAYIEAANLPASAKAKIILLIGDTKTPNIHQRSQAFINGTFDDLINDRPEDFLKILEKGKEYITIRSNIERLYLQGDITKNESGVFYMSELLGPTFEDAVTWFMTTADIQLKTALLNKLKN